MMVRADTYREQLKVTVCTASRTYGGEHVAALTVVTSQTGCKSAR